MNYLSKLLLGGGGAGILVAGCAAAAHARQLQPHAVSPPPGSAVPAPVKSPAVQLGVDVDAYTYRGQDIGAAAVATVAYIRSLHANAVAITYPFYMNGIRAPGVHVGAGTPTPEQLEVVVLAAERAGLRVTLRPLLDESSIGGHFRGDLRPARPRRWFASYRRFLLPYAAMGQQAHAATLVVGTELTDLRHSPLWYRLDAALRRVYHGQLSFDSNWWGYPQLRGAGGTVAEGVDAYPPIPARLYRGWLTYDRTLPAGTVESEVGIAAAPDAFLRPWVHQWPGQPVAPSAQARWFTAACRAALAAHLGGIYFWSVGLGTQFAGPTAAVPLNWGHSSGAAAIRACFEAADGGALR